MEGHLLNAESQLQIEKQNFDSERQNFENTKNSNETKLRSRISELEGLLYKSEIALREAEEKAISFESNKQKLNEVNEEKERLRVRVDDLERLLFDAETQRRDALEKFDNLQMETKKKQFDEQVINDIAGLVLSDNWQQELGKFVQLSKRISEFAKNNQNN